SGTRVQYTQPPNGSLNGMPSSSTSVRLWPLGPIPRSDTPCVVGCATRLLVRRNRLKVGTWRSTSSATSAGDAAISRLLTTLTLAGVSPRRCSLRVGVTVTVSNNPAGARTTSMSPVCAAGTFSVFSAKPPARTITVTSPVSGASTVKRPSGPVVTRRSGPNPLRTITAAPETTSPVESLTTTETEEIARTRKSTAIKVVLQMNRGTAKAVPYFLPYTYAPLQPGRPSYRT